jgi:leader peptidase (prepilin peptidase) / N-methyltransferase
MSVFELLGSSPGLFIGTCLLLGLLVGSFLNVVIYRLPIMLDRQWREQSADPAGFSCPPTGSEPTPAAARISDTATGTGTAPPRPEPFNLVVPRSACPSCKAPITALQNIPVISYLILRGRCARCSARIAVRYPLVEALTGILSAAVAWKFGFGWPTAGGILLTWFLIALTFIDVDHQLLPDSLTLPLMWIGLFLSLWGQPAGNASLPVDVRSAVIGAIAGYLSLWSVYHLFRLLTGKEGMGYGDFKLFAALGAWLGWKMLLPIILGAASVGAIVGIAIMAVRAIRGQQYSPQIPFGPFLAAAGWLTLMFGPELVTTYLGMFAQRP